MPAERRHQAGPSAGRRHVLPPIAGAGDEADVHAHSGDEGEEEAEAGPATGLTLKTKSKSKNVKKAKSAGVVYISRLPPGMTPHKVRHLMAKWGEVGRVYAQRRDGGCWRCKF